MCVWRGGEVEGGKEGNSSSSGESSLQVCPFPLLKSPAKQEDSLIGAWTSLQEQQVDAPRTSLSALVVDVDISDPGYKDVNRRDVAFKGVIGKEAQ